MGRPLAVALRAARSLGALLFPVECAACPSPAGPASVFCGACGEPIAYVEADVGGVSLVSAGRYAPPLSTAIARIKFEERPDLIAPLSRLLLPALRGLELTSGDV